MWQRGKEIKDILPRRYATTFGFDRDDSFAGAKRTAIGTKQAMLVHAESVLKLCEKARPRLHGKCNFNKMTKRVVPAVQLVMTKATVVMPRRLQLRTCQNPESRLHAGFLMDRREETERDHHLKNKPVNGARRHSLNHRQRFLSPSLYRY